MTRRQSIGRTCPRTISVGKAPEDWIPLRPESFYTENDIDLRLTRNVVNIEVGTQQVVLASGERVPYDRLLLASGAEPAHLTGAAKCKCSSFAGR